jgi:hypothetical protein
MYANSEIPMFTTQDPLAEKYYSLSPYMYCAGNPLRYIDPNGMDWYSYEEKYIDENNEEQTRIQYKYFDYELSKKEMEKGGYTHLGKTHLEDGKYYSLGGAVLEYDKNNPLSAMGLQFAMSADASVIATVNAIEGVASFWDKYHNMVGTGSNTATMIGEFMNYSKGFKGIVKWTGIVSTVTQAIKDGNSIVNGTMNREGYIDAVFNIVSLAGTPGAAISLGYNTAKAGEKGLNRLEMEFRNKALQIFKNRMTWP